MPTIVRREDVTGYEEFLEGLANAFRDQDADAGGLGEAGSEASEQCAKQGLARASHAQAVPCRHAAGPPGRRDRAGCVRGPAHDRRFARFFAGLLGMACLSTGPRSMRAQILTFDTSVATELDVGGLGSVIDVASVSGTSIATLIKQETGGLVIFFHTDGADRRRIDAALRDAISPMAIAGGVGSRSVFVLDSWGPAVIRVDFANDGTVTSGSPTRLSLSGATDLCVVQNRLLVLGADSPVPTSIVHEFTLDYQHVRSYGDPWPTLSTSGQPGAYAAGRIGCSRFGEWVVVASLLHPDVRGYSMDGSLMWTVPVTDFISVGLELQEPAGIMYRLPDDGMWDRVIGVSPVQSNLVTVQIGRSMGLDAKRGFVSIGTHFIDARDGVLVGFQSELPHVAEFIVDSELAIAYSDGEEQGTPISARRYEIRERSK